MFSLIPPEAKLRSHHSDSQPASNCVCRRKILMILSWRGWDVIVLVWEVWGGVWSKKNRSLIFFFFPLIFLYPEFYWDFNSIHLFLFDLICLENFIFLFKFSFSSYSFPLYYIFLFFLFLVMLLSYSTGSRDFVI